MARLDSRGLPQKTSTSEFRARSVSFAAVLLIIVGVFHAVQGLTAVLSDDYLASPKGYFLGTDTISTWGWGHLLLGIAAAVGGWGLLQRAGWARGVCVIVVTLSMMVSFLWIPIYPVAALVVIALDIFVMWAAFADLERKPPSTSS